MRNCGAGTRPAKAVPISDRFKHDPVSGRSGYARRQRGSTRRDHKSHQGAGRGCH